MHICPVCTAACCTTVGWLLRSRRAVAARLTTAWRWAYEALEDALDTRF